MAPSREQIREWQRQAAPGEGIRGWFDRGAWSAAGQREPWLFSWPRALLFALSTIVLIGVLVALGVTEATTLVGGSIGVTIIVARARVLHRRYVERQGSGLGR